MRHENEKLIISRKGHKRDGETKGRTRERGYKAREHEYERGDTLPLLLTLLCH